MKEFWEDLDGWFNFNALYLEMINQFDKGIFVEIGSWKGRSAGFMALNIKKAKKKIKFYAVDIFEPFMQGGVLEQGVNLEDISRNLASVSEYVTIMKGSSHDVHTMFEDESIDFLFIDACHDYEAVKKDIEFWFPKVKKGGVIAGHDYQWEGVQRAADEFFTDKGGVKMREACGSWIAIV